MKQQIREINRNWAFINTTDRFIHKAALHCSLVDIFGKSFKGHYNFLLYATITLFYTDTCLLYYLGMYCTLLMIAASSFISPLIPEKPLRGFSSRSCNTIQNLQYLQCDIISYTCIIIIVSSVFYMIQIFQNNNSACFTDQINCSS